MDNVLTANRQKEAFQIMLDVILKSAIVMFEIGLYKISTEAFFSGQVLQW